MILSLALSNCTADSNSQAAKAKTEIEQAEKEFDKMAAEKGIAEAFWFFADSNAVIKRGNDSLIHGKEGIRNFYSGNYYKKATVTWSPDFVDASISGDRGYTYGKYIWRSTDSTGTVIEAKGIFHTVWKKQPDGSWKYVWD
jgi:ketosteroid isomerase-like protein